jgi:suppressor for copper-sensitivity B
LVEYLRIRPYGWATVLCASVAFHTASARAADTQTSSGWALTSFSQVRLIAAATGAGADGTLRIGFHARLDPGWHLYWRSPGDTGAPTQFDFSASQNVSAVTIDWPAPHRASLLGFNAWVYDDEVVLPMTVLAEDAGAPIRIEAAAVYAICKDICTYHNETFVLTLPTGSHETTPYGALIDAFSERVPKKSAGGSLDVTRIATAPDRVVLEVSSTTTLGAVDAAIEGPPGFVFGLPTVTYGHDRRTAVLGIPTDFVGSERPPQADFVFTVMDGARAIERRRVVSTGP